ncbi:hypothetical protein EDC61_105143 [Sulfuritortus calidifontis]|uniref:Glycosyltransferase involved in cell wall biosynthesis n=1 Tax=Sulfuritortus calidifontis TaxID=1914471 RepID=A0A4V2UQT8_9PROT|nr:hypothetical protein [Sulfuritortus calidifontis]TCS72488.1 hypothetical protein EDC61_105143 [Sulfuritortus calidifontis]
MSGLPLSARLRRAKTNFKIMALRGACWLGGPRFASWFIVMTSDWRGYKPGRPTVIALYRPLFSKDLAELRKRTDLNWVYINNEYLAHVQSAWAPREVREQTFYQRYRTGYYEKTWKKLEEFGVELIKRLQTRTDIGAFMTSHIDYWHAEGIRLGAKKVGIPFVGLCREHMCLPIEQRTVTEYYKDFIYEGDAIAVFGDATRNIFINSGACRPDQVVVTGAPRLDIWRDIVWQQGQTNFVVLLSYRDPDYRAPQSFAEVLDIFLQCAEKHKDETTLSFLVKAKNLQDAEEIRGMAGKHSANVTIDHEIQLPDLLPRSRLVIGFNSLSLLEARFTAAQVVVPFWGDARRHPDELIFNPADPVTRKVVDFPESPVELETLLNEAIVCQNYMRPNVEDRLAVIQKVFYFPADCTCSENVEAFVRSRMKKPT